MSLHSLHTDDSSLIKHNESQTVNQLKEVYAKEQSETGLSLIGICTFPSSASVILNQIKSGPANTVLYNVITIVLTDMKIKHRKHIDHHYMPLSNVFPISYYFNLQV